MSSSFAPLSPAWQPDDHEPEWNNWKWQVANRLTTEDDLAGFVSQGEIKQLKRVIERYPWGSTPYFLSLINRQNPRDPVAAQAIPSKKELDFSIPGSDEDPLAETRHMPVPGLIHRYHDRALVITTGACFSYCRHCNRKRNWKRGIGPLGKSAISKICQYLKATPRIREVILSGGDPLTLPLEKLDRLLHALSSISHVQVLRIGTRAPVVLPMRITSELVSLLKSYRPLWVNTHFNHPVEITDESAAACDRLLLAGIPVSNHTVLLKGVNDDFSTLHRLFTGLNRIMVRPYYLFHCDAAKGTDHFRTSVFKGIEIMSRLYGRTGGLCLPQYVVDLPSGGGKAPVMPSYLLGVENGVAIFRTSEGRIIKYQGVHGATEEEE